MSISDNIGSTRANAASNAPNVNPFILPLPPPPPALNINELRPNKLDLFSPTASLIGDDYVEPDAHDQSSQIETEMTLKFDIQRPILDSILPKYFYLKYLSRAYVQNWNQVLAYPYYDDHKTKNINFDYRQKGFDCSYVSSRSTSSSSTAKPNLIENNFDDYFSPNSQNTFTCESNQETAAAASSTNKNNNNNDTTTLHDKEEEEELKCKIN